MRNRPDPSQQIRTIDDLASSSPKRMFALSPNDALVQIALPLVLILAIITRLMVISQSLAAQERGPVILEMWKQQLILRIDRVMDDWATQAELPAFPDFDRIQWDGAYPADERFRKLCAHSQTLNDREHLQKDLYHQALNFQTEDSGEGAPPLALYDPLAAVQPPNPEDIPAELLVTPERRAYALGHIDKRILQWQQQVENLQWATVAECAARLPLKEQSDTERAPQQLQRISTELAARGYPFIDRVTQEYGRIQ